MAELRLSRCPFCDKAGSASFNTERQIGKCFRCSSIIHQDDIDTGSRVGRDSSYRYRVPELMSAWDNPSSLAYLSNRGVSYADDPDIRYSPSEKRVWFRIWSPSPEFTPAWHTRSIDPKGKWIARAKDRRHYVYGAPIEAGAPVCLVEGIFDALRIGPGAIALLGTEMSETLLVWLGSQKPWDILLWLDPDEAGRKATCEIAARLRSAGLNRILIDATEPGDLPPGHKYVEEVKAFLRQRKGATA